MKAYTEYGKRAKDEWCGHKDVTANREPITIQHWIIK